MGMGEVLTVEIEDPISNTLKAYSPVRGGGMYLSASVRQMTYTEFRKNLQDSKEFRQIFQPLQVHVVGKLWSSLDVEMSRDLGRLKFIQQSMVEILNVVDPDGIWYPVAKRHRIEENTLEDDASLAQRVCGMIPQVLIGTLGLHCVL